MQLIIPFLALNLLLLLNLSKHPSFPALVSGLAPSHESNVAYDGTYDTALASHENQYVHDGRFRRRTFSLLPPGLDGIRHLLQLICSHTAYPGTCIQELSSFKISDLSSLNPLDLVSFSVRAATNRANEALNLASRFASGSGSSSSLEDQCANDCVSLISDAKDELNAAVSKLSSMQSSSIGSMRSSLRDVKVWMSSALSYQEACSDGLELVPGGSSARYEIRSNLEYLSEVIGNGYTLVDTLAQVGGDLGTWISGNLPTIPPPYVHLRRRRRLLSNLDASSFPRWVGAAERKLLQSNSSVVPSPDVTVAADGTGDYLNITAALRDIPDGDRGGSRYVIYIKAGVYEEVFNISKDMKKLTFIGDGIGNTVITGSRNVASGLYNTYRTSTVGISGSGFLARDITFRNTAGPSGHQAVALRAAADFLVFYRCSFEGYQDTLYALSSRQFYRECRITGTVDFIFGNAIAIFQNCELLARQPNDGQQNTYTAQGRKLAADVSGFSFQNCTVGPEAGGVTAPTFLGRPWKAYSRVIFMQSDIGAIVDPAGWLQWNESNPFIDTLFYGEYENRGPGATTGGRVPWPGVHPNLTRDEADTFTVSNFIAGDEWLSPLQVQYHTSLF